MPAWPAHPRPICQTFQSSVDSFSPTVFVSLPRSRLVLAAASRVSLPLEEPVFTHTHSHTNTHSHTHLLIPTHTHHIQTRFTPVCVYWVARLFDYLKAEQNGCVGFFHEWNACLVFRDHSCARSGVLRLTKPMTLQWMPFICAAILGIAVGSAHPALKTVQT